MPWYGGRAGSDVQRPAGHHGKPSLSVQGHSLGRGLGRHDRAGYGRSTSLKHRSCHRPHARCLSFCSKASFRAKPVPTFAPDALSLAGAGSAHNDLPRTPRRPAPTGRSGVYWQLVSSWELCDFGHRRSCPDEQWSPTPAVACPAGRGVWDDAAEPENTCTLPEDRQGTREGDVEEDPSEIPGKGWTHRRQTAAPLMVLARRATAAWPTDITTGDRPCSVPDRHWAPASPHRTCGPWTGEIFGWCCQRGSNSRPLPYQGSALPLSYGSAPTGRAAYCHRAALHASLKMIFIRRPGLWAPEGA